MEYTKGVLHHNSDGKQQKDVSQHWRPPNVQRSSKHSRFYNEKYELLQEPFFQQWAVNRCLGVYNQTPWNWQLAHEKKSFAAKGKDRPLTIDFQWKTAVKLLLRQTETRFEEPKKKHNFTENPTAIDNLKKSRWILNEEVPNNIESEPQTNPWLQFFFFFRHSRFSGVNIKTWICLRWLDKINTIPPNDGLLVIYHSRN